MDDFENTLEKFIKTLAEDPAFKSNNKVKLCATTSQMDMAVVHVNTETDIKSIKKLYKKLTKA